MLVLACLFPTGLHAQSDPVSRARQAYNQRQYDDAIRLATDARRVPATADAAAVVFARAHLERYRQTMEPADLDEARTALVAAHDERLSPRDHVERTIGLGESLFFDRRFNVAAEFFELALAHLDVLEPGARDGLVEWWASALDQQAQLGPESERRPLYVRILQRAEDELRRDDRSAVGTYWLAAAARGVSDFDRAWAAAAAGWIRASSFGAAGAKLRSDLDRLVTTAIIPERAHQLSPTGDPHPAMTLLQEQWVELKAKYGG